MDSSCTGLNTPGLAVNAHYTKCILCEMLTRHAVVTCYAVVQHVRTRRRAASAASQ